MTASLSHTEGGDTTAEQEHVVSSTRCVCMCVILPAITAAAAANKQSHIYEGADNLSKGLVRIVKS